MDENILAFVFDVDVFFFFLPPNAEQSPQVHNEGQRDRDETETLTPPIYVFFPAHTLVLWTTTFNPHWHAGKVR